MLNESDSIRYLKGVGEKKEKLFLKLGISNVGELLRFYPKRYIDKSNPVTLSKAPKDKLCAVKATVVKECIGKFIRKGMTVYTAYAGDDMATMKIVLFNNPYSAKLLEFGKELLFYGTVTDKLGLLEMTSPIIETLDDGAKIQPVYNQTDGLNSKAIGRAVSSALDTLADRIYDPLPDTIRNENKLCHIRFALENIHFPKDEESLKIARERLIFDELLFMQLGILKIKGRDRGANRIVIKNDYSSEFWDKLAFKPTKAQKRVVNEAIADMYSQKPMSRLVQGDVGSGKTAVAAAVCYSVVKNGFQCVLMAPTEILAEQHYKSLRGFFDNEEINVCLLTGSLTSANKRKIYNAIQNGDVNILVGTHAVISDNVIFKNLGLVVTDEQHRFGVKQRAALFSKGNNPHTLVMSATPIPRTLALMIYGDLDISVLDEMPPGRQKVATYAVDSSYRRRVLNYVKKHLDQGRQGYIVCPLVEEGEGDLLSAEHYYELLCNDFFKGYTLGLLHGKMKSSEKESVMRQFKDGEIQLLIATTVVEVGVDVPNAVIMVIENAERFGLSQLHQLRGRVGRGKYKSTCILITDAKSENTKKRMDIMCQTNDGFEISNEDLALRGPGDFLGERQHGLPELKIADFAEDMSVLRQTQKIAKNILKNDPDLIYPENIGLRETTDKMYKDLLGGFN